MVTKKERQVFHLDLRLTSKARGFKGLTPDKMKDVASYLKSSFDSGAAVYKRKSGNEIWYISDCVVTQEYACFLINLSDKMAPDPSFTDPLKNHRRDVTKSTGEGDDRSAHFIVWFNQIPKKPNMYPALLEFCYGITTPKVAQLFNRLLRTYSSVNRSSFERNNPDGSNNKVLVWPFLEIHGHMCDSLKDEIDQGVLKGIEMYTETNSAQNWDKNGYTVIEHELIKVKPQPHKISGGAFGPLKAIVGEGKKRNLEKARVRFVNAQDLARTVNIYTDNMSVVSDYKFIKKSKINGFSNPLKASYAEVYNPILKAMLNIP